MIFFILLCVHKSKKYDIMKEIEKFEAGHYEAGYDYNYFVPNKIIGTPELEWKSHRVTLWESRYLTRSDR